MQGMSALHAIADGGDRGKLSFAADVRRNRYCIASAEVSLGAGLKLKGGPR